MRETLYLTDIPNITISNHPQPKLYPERMLKGTQFMNILERLVFPSLGYFSQLFVNVKQLNRIFLSFNFIS